MTARGLEGGSEPAVTGAPPATEAEVAGPVASFGGGSGEGSLGETPSFFHKDHLRRTAVVYQWNPPPVYPILGRERGWSGKVSLRVLVGPEGDVKKVQIASSSGYPALDESAARAVKTWRFGPATEQARPVPSWALVPMVFQLKD